MAKSASNNLQDILKDLKNGQKEAVSWDQGPLLVLAGPGSGKTRVLTLRIARLLEESRDKSYRILALTFTNKAAGEMRARLQRWVPDLLDRVNVGTFHSFCAEVLRTHGSRLGLSPDFKVFSDEADQLEIVQDILDAEDSYLEADKVLRAINYLRSNLVPPGQAASFIQDPEFGHDLESLYKAYNDSLLQQDALDFDGMIYWAVHLLERYPKLAEHYRRVYHFWCIDECQDTNLAQFRILTAMSGGTLKNIFAVADDDQVLYEWNGASHKRLLEFQNTFQATTIQLPTNFRCPVPIVELANRLISHNRNRLARASELRGTKSGIGFDPLLIHSSDEWEQASLIAQNIKERDLELDQIAILARSKKQLETVQHVFQEAEIPALLVQRQSDFRSADFRFLVASLRLSAERTSSRQWKAFLSEYRHLRGIEVDELTVMATAQASQGDLLFTFCQLQSSRDPELVELMQAALLEGSYQKYAQEFLKRFKPDPPDDDFEDDQRAWDSLVRDIRAACGANTGLPRFLQELNLRSKEPPASKTPHVQLLTVHSSKGKEFEHVYVIGLVEGSFPSYQATLRGDCSPEMEEERRSCYVAITRTLSSLTLTYPETMYGYAKQPSRFLEEMGLVEV